MFLKGLVLMPVLIRRAGNGVKDELEWHEKIVDLI